jgi:hypothetical protein
MSCCFCCVVLIIGQPGQTACQFQQHTKSIVPLSAGYKTIASILLNNTKFTGLAEAVRLVRVQQNLLACVS